mmetsp:Transcript_29040/g.81945  ORF Transcript_29040/g.81945 Transcript_29040/m.81945 type:complete len:277 (+) Transcript_29040:171-1001(+)
MPSRTRMPPLSPPPTTSHRGPFGSVGGAFGRGAGCGTGNSASSSGSVSASSRCSRVSRVLPGSGGPLSSPLITPRPNSDTFIAPVGSWPASSSFTFMTVAPMLTVTAVFMSSDFSIHMVIWWSPKPSGAAVALVLAALGASAAGSGLGRLSLAAASLACCFSQARTSSTSLLFFLAPSSAPRNSKSRVCSCCMTSVSGTRRFSRLSSKESTSSSVPLFLSMVPLSSLTVAPSWSSNTCSHLWWFAWKRTVTCTIRAAHARGLENQVLLAGRKIGPT